MTKITIYQKNINNKIYGLDYKTTDRLLDELDSFFQGFHWKADVFKSQSSGAFSLVCEVKTSYKHECINNIKDFLKKGLDGKLYENVNNSNNSIYLY